MNLENSAPSSVSINCGTLDMRETTEHAASRIGHVNTGNVLVTAETRPLMTMFSINMGSVIEVPVEVRLKTVHSREVMGREAFSGEGTRLFIMNSGSIILEPDVTVEGVESSWFGILNSGSILYPEHVAGAIMDKLTENPGSHASYRSSARLVVGDLQLDEVYLVSMANDTDMVITGDLQIVRSVPDELIDQKIKTLNVRGKVFCSEENLYSLGSRFDPGAGTPKTWGIPEGFEIVEHELSMKSTNVRTWKDRSIFATENVTIYEEVDQDTLDKALGGLICTGTVLCPDSLSEVLSQKCDTLKTRIVFYDGALWAVKTTVKLHKSRFDFLEGTATLYNTGVVTIAEDVDAQILYDHLAGVYNWGVIGCNPDQKGAVEARMVVNEGVVDVTEALGLDQIEPKAQEEEAEKDNRQINAGYYKL
ncbi:MAG: hypothetical protein OXO51_03875 [Gemmatimonadota bacterium]|nr:hypothetical protein [Gemmatimonadota bacterium]